MTPRWFIVIPAWGERHVATFRSPVLPAVLAALLRAGRLFDAQFLVHTDQPEAITSEFKTFGIERYTLCPKPVRISKYWAMSDCHRDALHQAHPGQYVAFINADMVPSIECFSAAERRFANCNDMLILTSAIRTSGGHPSAGLAARPLLEWAWEHRHHWTADCTWGSGATSCPSLLFFDDGANVIMRGFHLHPFAIIKPAYAMQFTGLTIDEGLAEVFPRRQIHVVTDPDEMAFAEMSPEGQMFKSVKTLSVASVKHWALSDNGKGQPRVSDAHKWMFEHRIVIRGSAVDALDVAVSSEVLKALT